VTPHGAVTFSVEQKNKISGTKPDKPTPPTDAAEQRQVL
jgi:hypothetical protein